LAAGELLLIVAVGAEPAPRGAGRRSVKFNWCGGPDDVSDIIGAAGEWR